MTDILNKLAALTSNPKELALREHSLCRSLIALVQEAAAEIERLSERELIHPTAETILEVFMEANTAFEHGDDVTHMLKFGEAVDMMKYHYHLKNGGDPSRPHFHKKEDGSANA